MSTMTTIDSHIKRLGAKDLRSSGRGVFRDQTACMHTLTDTTKSDLKPWPLSKGILCGTDTPESGRDVVVGDDWVGSGQNRDR